MSTLQTLQDIARDPAQVARQHKADGGKVAGYRCLPIPEELLWAADMLPYPLYGTPEPVGLADTYFQSCTCEFVRNVFDHALSGDLDFLDCLAVANTCDVVRRLYDIWGGYIEQTPVYLLNNPQKLLTSSNRDYYLEELRRLKGWLEGISGAEATDDKLREAIALHNKKRALLKEIYELREDDDPPLSGSEALEVSLAATVLPPDKANPLLEALLDELADRPAPGPDGPRILVTGSVLDHPALIRLIEDAGGQVVGDDLCTTTRYFWFQVDEHDDPLEAIYQLHNRRQVCACLHPMGARLEYLLELVDRCDAEGVVNFTLKYCHGFLYEAPLFKKALEERDVPTAVLEVGHDLSGHGQLSTRIQAFIEMIEL